MNTQQILKDIRSDLKNFGLGLLDFCAQMAEIHRRRMETPTACSLCQEIHLYKDLKPAWSQWIQTEPVSYTRTTSGKEISPHSYCPTCWKTISESIIRQQRLARQYRRETLLVEKHNERARLAGSEYTLTITQWLKTLEHYNWRCAYCGDLYEELEHRIPIDCRGGTTAKNCVPACRSCNRRKGSRHPVEIITRESSLSPEAHKRIEAEMETLHES